MQARHEKYERLIGAAKRAGSVPCAVAHPCDESSLRGAVHAALQGLIEPVLVGPQARIREIAHRHGLAISGYPVVDTSFSEGSAEAAVALAREGKVEMLMKGSLHTDELIGAVVKRESGLRTSR